MSYIHFYIGYTLGKPYSLLGPRICWKSPNLNFTFNRVKIYHGTSTFSFSLIFSFQSSQDNQTINLQNTTLQSVIYPVLAWLQKLKRFFHSWLKLDNPFKLRHQKLRFFSKETPKSQLFQQPLHKFSSKRIENFLNKVVKFSQARIRVCVIKKTLKFL